MSCTPCSSFFLFTLTFPGFPEDKRIGTKSDVSIKEGKFKDGWRFVEDVKIFKALPDELQFRRKIAPVRSTRYGTYSDVATGLSASAVGKIREFLSIRHELAVENDPIRWIAFTDDTLPVFLVALMREEEGDA